MNISTTNNIGALRRITAGALLAIAIPATAIGLAATSHADDDSPPADNPPAAGPPAAPWLPFADPGCHRPLFFFNGRVHCG